MNYMLLLYGDPAQEPAYGTPEFDLMMKGYFDFSALLKADGVLKGGEGLQGIETATSLRYYVIDVPDLDAALRYAAQVPAALYGTVEVRPLMDYNPAGN
jgi:hypothetical protein